jgi:threonine dehydratase
MTITKEDLLQARCRIEKYIHNTPVLSSSTFNSIIGGNIFFKCENFQKAGAFKFRGAINAVFSISSQKILKGVATHSSGNHAAALARAAHLRNTKAWIVMPENAPKVKIEAVKNYGGIIIFCEPTLSARESALQKIIDKTGATEIHPYNNEKVIAGQSTAVQEILEVIPRPEIIITPVGGGGLLSGSALAAHHFSPGTKVFAAEPLNANDAFLSFTSGTFIPSVNPKTIADGLLTSLGDITFPIIQDHVNQIITIDEHSIIEAMKWIWERMKLVIEPSSAVPVAAIFNNPEIFQNKTTVVILSGGNVDLTKLPWQ